VLGLRVTVVGTETRTMLEACVMLPCVCDWSLWTQYLINRLGEFHQIYNFGAIEDKDELIRFW